MKTSYAVVVVALAVSVSPAYLQDKQSIGVDHALVPLIHLPVRQIADAPPAARGCYHDRDDAAFRRSDGADFVVLSAVS